MLTKSISNPNILKVLDEATHATYYGCNQAWYTTEWQRRAGCGPSVVSNLMLYLTGYPAGSAGVKGNSNSKKNCLTLMEDIWAYVTPTDRGIPATKMLYEAVLKYTKAKGLYIKYGVCDLPQDRSLRPSLPEVLRFLAGALAKDVPVAFLNLCNGDEQNLYRWHWVTIISLEYLEDGSSALATILDEGAMKKIDLGLWYKTTTLGGGFVYFYDFAAAGDQQLSSS